MRLAQNSILLAFSLLLLSCGGGGGSSDIPAEVPIVERGFAESGIFFGVLNPGTEQQTDVLLVLHEPSYFLFAGNIVSQGTYSVASVELTGSGPGYDLATTEQLIGEYQLRGKYISDRHLDLTWLDTVSGAETNLLVEASDLYFNDSPLENVLGTWINQDQSNLTFLSIDNNLSPIAGDDYILVDPTQSTEIPVLLNDRDPDNGKFGVSTFDAVTDLGGVVTLDDMGTVDDKSDDKLFYSAPAGTTGTRDQFNYTIIDEGDSEASATAYITFEPKEADIALSLSADNLSPVAGDQVEIDLQLQNQSTDTATTQALLLLPDGLSYLSHTGGGVYNPASGFWLIDLAGGQREKLTVTVTVENIGDFVVSSNISGSDAVDNNSVNDTAEITLTPVNLQPEQEVLRTAAIEGIVLSSLGQISGSITEASDLRNAYAMVLKFGAGGLSSGGNESEALTGFAIINEELIATQNPAASSDPNATIDPNTTTDPTTTADPNATTDPTTVPTNDTTTTSELRQTMLILTTNSTQVYLNKLIFVTEEELAAK